jgi:hypothetical protein
MLLSAAGLSIVIPLGSSLALQGAPAMEREVQPSDT